MAQIAAGAGGFFRQSWATQLTEMQSYASQGDSNRIHFARDEGGIPTADDLEAKGIKLFFGVGHETTGATTYTEEVIRNLLTWIDLQPLTVQVLPAAGPPITP